MRLTCNLKLRVLAKRNNNTITKVKCRSKNILCIYFFSNCWESYYKLIKAIKGIVKNYTISTVKISKRKTFTKWFKEDL